MPNKSQTENDVSVINVKTKGSKGVNKKTINEDTTVTSPKKGRIITIIFSLLIVIGIIVGCMFSPAFDLDRIIVSDGINISKEEILNSFKLERGMNVFKVDYKKISKEITALPYIQTAKASLKFPNCVQIDYTEREPIALIKYLESYLVMDRYGYILEIDKEKKFDTLPIVYNIEFDSYEVGKKLSDTAKTKFDNIVYLLENAKQMGFEYTIDEINYESIGNVKIWVKEAEVEIIYGEIDKNIIGEKLKYIAEALKAVKGKKGRIDLSSENYLDKTVFTERY